MNHAVTTECATAPRRKRKSEKYLRPLKGKIKRKNILVFDIESKDGETQKAGFTRPFLVGVFDGENFLEFRNNHGLEALPWETRHIQRGGCVDNFMRWLLRLDGCRKCYGAYTLDRQHAGGLFCMDCAAHRKKYSSSLNNIYSHNGGRFDELFILGWLIENSDSVQFEVTAVQARIQRLDIWPTGLSQAKISWTFLDSFSILPLGLRQIGKDLLSGVKDIPAVKDADKLAKEKGTIDLDLEENDPAWTAYNKADLTVLYLALVQFHELIEGLGGEVGITTPATSMKVFRRAFQKKSIPRNRHFKHCDGICHHAKVGIDRTSLVPCAAHCDLTCHGCAHEFIRTAYYGGRVEKLGEYYWDYKYFDLNSSYPASMLEDMPVGEMAELGPEVSWATLRQMRKTHIGFVECTVEIPEDCYIPPLPYRDVEKRKLVFPTGELTGVWSFDELELLFDQLVNGSIIRVYRSVWYKKAPIFRDMILKLYHYRQKHINGCKTGDDKLGTACHKPSCNPDYTPGMALVAKLLLNSLYGKFGMREERTGVVFVGKLQKKPSDGWPVHGNDENCRFWEVERYVDAAYIIPQISAHITALSRIRLWRGMAGVVSRGGRLFYVDTDSIKASIEIPFGDALGEWKREDPDILLEGVWVTSKFYRKIQHKKDCAGPPCRGCAIVGHRHDCKDKDNGKCGGCAVSEEKMKGVSYNMQTPEVFKLLTDEGGTVHGTRLSQYRTMIHMSLLSPTIVDWSKSVATEYDKRVMLANGDSRPIHIQPIRLEEEYSMEGL